MYDVHFPPWAVSSYASAIREAEEMNTGEFISHAGIVSAR